jgi:hypothetical protein
MCMTSNFVVTQKREQISPITIPPLGEQMRNKGESDCRLVIGWIYQWQRSYKLRQSYVCRAVYRHIRSHFGIIEQFQPLIMKEGLSCWRLYWCEETGLNITFLLKTRAFLSEKSSTGNNKSKLPPIMLAFCKALGNHKGKSFFLIFKFMRL